jgi:16S rRNA (guanine527-N7)-methyltransferase
MQKLLTEGLNTLGIPATAQQIEQWLSYVRLLDKWNNAYNLTAVRLPMDMVSRHVLDSLSIAQYVTSRQLLDVGAGAGIPSIPLAILWPDRQITALDSNGKKTRFMQQARGELSLANFAVVQTRIEDYQPESLFDGVMSRAFSSLADFVQSSKHVCKEDGAFWAMKAVIDPAELSALPKPYKVSTCLPLAVPGCEAERHLVVIKQAS